MDQTLKPKTTPKDFFLQIASIATLYISVISLLTVIFEVINRAFPDNLYGNNYYDVYSSGMRMAIASLFVIFPIYLVLMWLINRDYVRFPEKKDLTIHRWLSYFTLFVAGAVIAGDLIVLLNTFLGGEITTRFVLKVLSVFVVTGLAFTYYLLDLQSKLTSVRRNIFRTVSVAVVLLAIVFGFVYMGSPATARKLKLDNQRVSSLQQLQSTIIYSYWQQKGELPSKLEDLNSLIDYRMPTDPETKESFVYKKTGNLTFELCANFDLESNQADPQYDYRPIDMSYDSKGAEQNFKHPAGYHCFERVIDPDLYPVVEKKAI